MCWRFSPHHAGFETTVFPRGKRLLKSGPQKNKLVKFLVDFSQGSIEGYYQYELGSTQIFLTSWHVIAFSQTSSNMVRCSQPRGTPPNWASEAPHLLPVRCQTHKQNKAIFFIKLGCLRYFMTKSRNIKQNQMDELSVTISSKRASFCLPAPINSTEWHSCRKERTNSLFCGGLVINLG